MPVPIDEVRAGHQLQGPQEFHKIEILGITLAKMKLISDSLFVSQYQLIYHKHRIQLPWL